MDNTKRNIKVNKMFNADLTDFNVNKTKFGQSLLLVRIHHDMKNVQGTPPHTKKNL
jgi:hypothetical protein